MDIHSEFAVSVPAEEAWAVLTDLERIAPCMPGAKLTGVEGEVFSGSVKVKVGPVTSEYTGTATFAERDDAAWRAVISAKGRDARGAGNASATITAQLRPDGDHTSVTVDTDLKISGKVAQFGSGMIAEVSEKLLGQFVDCLETKLLSGNAPGGPEAAGPGQVPGSSRPAGPGTSSGQVAPAAPATDPAPVDLVALAGGSVAKRVAPVVAGVAAAALVVYLVRRR